MSLLGSVRAEQRPAPGEGRGEGGETRRCGARGAVVHYGRSERRTAERVPEASVIREDLANRAEVLLPEIRHAFRGGPDVHDVVDGGAVAVEIRRALGRLVDRKHHRAVGHRREVVIGDR